MEGNLGGGFLCCANMSPYTLLSLPNGSLAMTILLRKNGSTLQVATRQKIFHLFFSLHPHSSPLLLLVPVFSNENLQIPGLSKLIK